MCPVNALYTEGHALLTSQAEALRALIGKADDARACMLANALREALSTIEYQIEMVAEDPCAEHPNEAAPQWRAR